MRRVGWVAIGVVLLPMQLAANCVDGVTPDCSDAAAMCGPDLDGAIEADTSVALPDATSADAPSPDATDAADESDGGPEAGDAGDS